jgi:hypothetical protein
MNKLIVVFFSFLLAHSVYAVGSESLRFSVIRQGTEHKEGPVGNRMPGSKIECYINFNTYTIIMDLGTRIVEYEIYDELEESCIMTFLNETEFTQYLSLLEGAYVLKFKTDDSVYIGYIEL